MIYCDPYIYAYRYTYTLPNKRMKPTPLSFINNIIICVHRTLLYVHIIIYCITIHTYILMYTFTGRNRQTCTNILYQIFITCICGNSSAGTLPRRLNPSDYVYMFVCIIIYCMYRYNM